MSGIKRALEVGSKKMVAGCVAGVDRALGFYGLLMHWDTLVLDRWFWLRDRFRGLESTKVLDVGCGGGAFTIGLALLGHQTLGLTYDQESLAKARLRAKRYPGAEVDFRICDARQLSAETDLQSCYDFVICLECIEHILDDDKLMKDMARCLKPGGRLLLTSPNLEYIPITPGDEGPFLTEETGWHVRKGYSPERLMELCERAGLGRPRISYCSGLLSQKITWVLRTTAGVSPMLAHALIMPLRILPPIFDPLLTRITGWPPYSICLEAIR